MQGLFLASTRRVASRRYLSPIARSVSIRTMSTKKPIPILATGQREIVGKPVCDGLMPEFEAIHFTLSSAIEKELPALLKDNTPPPKDMTFSSAIGTGNWSSPPVALVLGGAYSDADIQRLREAVNKDGPVRKIPWVRIDSSKSVAVPPSPEYVLEVISRFKKGLTQLEEEGRLEGGDDGVYAV